jgi:hypothetical protein
MKTLLFNEKHTVNSFQNREAFTVIKEKPIKKNLIQNGMTINEISDIVSEKIINVVKEQFEQTKINFESLEKKKLVKE